MGISAAIGIGLAVGSMSGKGKLPDPLGIHDPDVFGLPDPLALMKGSKESAAAAKANQPPASPQAPGMDNARAGQAGAQQRKRAQQGQGRSDTVKTGPSGLGEIGAENQERKTLLGY